MEWIKTCIKNRLLIYIIAILTCVFGLFSLYTMPITPFPQIPINHIYIQFSYPGASANTVQNEITTKVVNSLKATNNVESIKATSRDGGADIDLTLNSNNQSEALETQIKIMQAIASSHLPNSVPQPVVTQAAGTSGLITFVVSSNKLSLFQLDNFIQSTLYPKFSTLPGVALFARDQNPSVKIKLNPEKLAKYKLNTSDIADKINSAYSDNPMGDLYINKQPYTLGISNDIHSLDQLKNLVISYSGSLGNPVYLKDIAKISFEPESIIPNYYSSFNGHVADGINLYTRARANPFLISKETKSYIKNIEKHLPDNIKITPIFDAASTMHIAYNEVIWTILIASILVLIIAFLFLGHLRSTLIPMITIPICLLGSIVIINILGYSINLITLLALVIAVGLVVDDAIVVVENVTRYVEQGMKKFDAILHGTSNIALTIIGITLTLLAVYLPITFCNGMFITLLKSFAMPLAAAVFISGIVALTLTPVMCVYLLDDKLNLYQRKFNWVLAVIIAKYQRLLTYILNFPKRSLAIIIILVASLAYLSLQLPREFFPSDPDGTVHVSIAASGQDNFLTLKNKSEKFKPFYTNKKVDYYSLEITRDPTTGKLGADISIHYKSRYLHQNLDFADAINNFIKTHNIDNASANIEKFSNAGSNADMSLTIYGADTTNNINQIAARLTKDMKSSSVYSSVINTINQPNKQIQFSINSVKAERLGIFQSQIAQLLSIYYGGYTLNNDFNIDGLNVPVVMQLDSDALMNPNSIEQLQVQSPSTHKFYPLNEFVSLKTVAKPEDISTFNGLPSVDIQASLAKGISLSKAIEYTDHLIKTQAPLLQYQYTGNAKLYLKGNNQTIFIIILGILSIYCLLVILFRSLLEPFIILFTVPFTVVGGAASLYLVGGTINLYSTLALITLVGLITKHGVMIVQFADHELKEGAGLTNAIITATHHRFRPIIMTTLAMSLGALPLVLSSNLMYVARRDLGIVIIGGLLIGTFFSLFIVPLVYILFKRALLRQPNLP